MAPRCLDSLGTKFEGHPFDKEITMSDANEFTVLWIEAHVGFQPVGLISEVEALVGGIAWLKWTEAQVKVCPANTVPPVHRKTLGSDERFACSIRQEKMCRALSPELNHFFCTFANKRGAIHVLLLVPFQPPQRDVRM